MRKEEATAPSQLGYLAIEMFCTKWRNNHFHDLRNVDAFPDSEANASRMPPACPFGSAFCGIHGALVYRVTCEALRCRMLISLKGLPCSRRRICVQERQLSGGSSCIASATNINK